MSIIVLVGPSGSGKDTIGDGLAENGIPELVSFTTRKMRVGERSGVDYYYLNKEDLYKLDIVEYDEYAGNIYGLLTIEVNKSLEKNENVYFVANESGAKSIKEMYPEETIVFWLDVDMKTMRSRMYSRGDSESEIEKRLSYAVNNKELEKPDIKELNVLDGSRSPEDLVKQVLYIVKKEKEHGK